MFDARRITKLHPCVIESLNNTTFPSLFVVGSYQLCEETNSRQGAIEIYDSTLNKQLSLLEISSGVLDIRVINENSILVADSLGSVHLINIVDLSNNSNCDNNASENMAKFDLKQVSSWESSDDGLALAVDFYDTSIIKTHQNGSIHLGQMTPTGFIDTQHITNAHTLLGESQPIWTVTFNKHNNGNTFLTGGDDCKMKLWDIRTDLNTPNAINSISTAGVTAIQYHPTNPHIFVNGSYDEYARIYDDRNFRVPVMEL